ncbi:hypothetical protein MLD38_019222 [Melastoma candidum]|uniref:Uncharacterized protein n=1 Tax=Melastoma candidum TaxID=119954 RepID=A0ACB9QY75_9MYRT|nr:hypothetical protein MLD38_019222 [Melastoma candidum]
MLGMVVCDPCERKAKVLIWVLGLVVGSLCSGFVEAVDQQRSSSTLVSCGANSSLVVDGRRWIGDSNPENGNLTLSLTGVVAVSSELSGDSAKGTLYGSARVFENPSNYTIRGVHGDCFLRLHFCPFSFDGRSMNESRFGVVADGMRLMTEYNVRDEILNRNSRSRDSGGNNSSYLIKEYFLSVVSGELVIEFLPSEGSNAFVNAIEVIPAVNKLFRGSLSKVGGNAPSLNVSGRGMETLYRLDVGGPGIKPSEDSDLWRTWEADTGYMINAVAGSEVKNSSNISYASTNDSSSAPLLLYESAKTISNAQVLEKRINMSWKLFVDPDFDYLVRLHFCELQYEQPNERNFRIYVNNRTAADNYDIYVQAGGKNRAYHQDYMDTVPAKLNTLWIQLGPETATSAAATDALLNGLEVFKLSRNGNLASIDRFSFPSSPNEESKAITLWLAIGVGAASVVILAVIAALLFLFCKRRRRHLADHKDNAPGWRPLFLHGAITHSTANAKGTTTGKSQNGSVQSARIGRRFTIAEIKTATKNFDEGMVIGFGGFGKVYRGEIEDGVLVAIKRAHPQSQQGLAEFETEIEMLSKLRHRHLVSLIGFCEENNEMILVYECMGNGTLRSHLFGYDLPPLSWKQRLEVCIGAARGLHYLHTGADGGIIHRDVKTTNILLDEDFVAKMSDFGLSKTGPALDRTHVSTAVKGSFGYLDPEYFRRQQLTEKSDVYSFGVVLFEVVCARAVIDPSLPKDQINLAEWALRWQQERSLEVIIDPRLRGKYSPQSMEKFGEIAEKCLADEGRNRPTMGDVLWHLEYSLQLHEAWLLVSATETQDRGRNNEPLSDELS